jgi:hypothetical protein
MSEQQFTAGLRGHSLLRGKCVRERERLGGLEAWARANDYGKRWAVESTIGSFKNLFGENVTSKKYWNIVREVKFKWSLLNAVLTLP